MYILVRRNRCLLAVCSRYLVVLQAEKEGGRVSNGVDCSYYLRVFRGRRCFTRVEEKRQIQTGEGYVDPGTCHAFDLQLLSCGLGRAVPSRATPCYER